MNLRFLLAFVIFSGFASTCLRAQYQAVDISINKLAHIDGDSHLSMYETTYLTANPIFEIGYLFDLSSHLTLRPAVGYGSRTDYGEMPPVNTSSIGRESRYTDIAYQYFRVAMGMQYYFHEPQRGVFVRGELGAIINIAATKIEGIHSSNGLSFRSIDRTADYSHNVNTIVPIVRIDFGYDFVIKERFRPFIAVGIGVKPTRYIKSVDDLSIIAGTLSVGLRYALTLGSDRQDATDLSK